MSDGAKHDARRVFLSGPPGSGKSTVGRALAAATDAPFVDLDARVAARAGKPIARIFAEDGEPAFRAMEREEAMRVSLQEGPLVVALGGGTVVDRDTRRALVARGTLIGLDADLDVLVERARAQTVRPLLAGDPSARLEALLNARRDAYAERAACVRTDRLSVDEVVRDIVAVVQRDPIVVALGSRSYVVEVGRALAPRVAAVLASLAPTSVLVVADTSTVGQADRLAERARAAGMRTDVVTLPSGEEHKTAATVGRVWDAALAFGIDRGALVVAVGGGVVSDLAGFAAATLLRGVRFVSMPTTLLAMVDASVGGKTGFDHALGKNLVGAFHQPSAVLIDLDALATLPDRHVRAGLAEVVKMALVVGEEAFAAIERDAVALVGRDHGAIERAVRMAVRAKADVVARDERETLGLRDVLNVGHTVGHALEADAGYGDALLHGEAVGLGIIAELAAFCGEPGGPTRALLDRARGLLDALGLPTDVAGRLHPRLVELLARDKKRAGNVLRVPCVEAPGKTVTKRLAAKDLLRLAAANLSGAPSLR